jgi:multidrug transporter EmrE-like cation transporter
LPVIVINYATCLLLGASLLISQKTVHSVSYSNLHPWLIWAALLGVVFILIFNAMGQTTAHFGVTVTAIASKMAMVIPAIFFLFLDKKHPSLFFITGIIAGILAIFFMTFTKNTANKKNNTGKIWLLPFTVWIGSGLIDISLKLLEIQAANIDHLQIWISTAICLGALIVGTILLGIKKQFFQLKNYNILFAGIMLGLPNFGSIAFLLKAFSAFNQQTEILFPINHIGIVMLSALVSIILFKEAFSKLKIVGLALAIASLLFLNYAHG